MCCMAVAPFSTNSYTWGNICGYQPQSPSELIGGRCITISSGTCPAGSISTCCAGVWPGPSGQCALGTNCGAPTITSSSSTTPTPSAIPAPLPPSWSATSPCATDTPSRIIANDVTTTLSQNTPGNCIAHCAAGSYLVAGVENGNECHCGTTFVSGAPTTIDSSLCSTRCSGDNRYTCGGAWAIQVYAGPSPVRTYPAGWSVAEACAVDVPSRIIADDVTTILDNNTPAGCMLFCQAAGYSFAGVEYGDECHCGTGFAGGKSPTVAPSSDCSVPCAGDHAQTCGGSWRMQVYSFAL